MLKCMGHSDLDFVGSEFDAPNEAVVTATESPDDGGVDLEKSGSKPANKLLDVDRRVDH